ncbi:MAG: four helix bundle suffix domain-containing protein [Paludibacteraceae bacterium]|nr:four helix bundle suffix domain-containing protein [Paludibacteraceae bacterium]
MHNIDDKSQVPTILNKQANWNDLYFYQKADVVYQLSFMFCDRFIHLYKDRTRDQVIQAARSCKQNIVEGLADGVTSTEMQLKLLNVARASLKELKEDFEDYLKSRHLRFYSAGDKEYDPMLEYCRHHNKLADYEPYFLQWTDEEACNYGITLCHMIDKMMMTFLAKLDREFVTQGGIKERMHRARTGYRLQQDELIKQLEEECNKLKAQLSVVQTEAQHWKAAYEDLKSRALKAFYKQQDEIESLKERLK